MMYLAYVLLRAAGNLTPHPAKMEKTDSAAAIKAVCHHLD